MKLHIVFGQRIERYDGEHAPEPLLCWADTEVEENPEGFEADVQGTIERRRAEFSAIRVIGVTIDGDAVRRYLNETPDLTGTVEPLGERINPDP